MSRLFVKQKLVSVLTLAVIGGKVLTQKIYDGGTTEKIQQMLQLESDDCSICRREKTDPCGDGLFDDSNWSHLYAYGQYTEVKKMDNVFLVLQIIQTVCDVISVIIIICTIK